MFRPSHVNRRLLMTLRVNFTSPKKTQQTTETGRTYTERFDADDPTHTLLSRRPHLRPNLCSFLHWLSHVELWNRPWNEQLRNPLGKGAHLDACYCCTRWPQPVPSPPSSPSMTWTRLIDVAIFYAFLSLPFRLISRNRVRESEMAMRHPLATFLPHIFRRCHR
ncbi:hypothetical protein BHE74_00006440 [Ensete ventricosum]|nr:hypothetical protein GW17_00021923 [Ensete ventricosum]RWW84911.1 hypothetical protein BHE74_00006440 [Ensete ventricosum]RZR77131.1 hypothetical protein BHM03_00002120 [Ensete ventricosum]